MVSLKRNKWIWAAVTAAVAASALAGCAGGDSKNTATPEATKQPEKRGSVSLLTKDIADIDPAIGTANNNIWTKWINENGPSDVTFVPFSGNMKEKVNLMFASGSAPDIIANLFDPSLRNDLYAQKQLLPLDDLINKSSTEYKKMLEDYPVLKKLGTKEDGKLYEIGRIQQLMPELYLLVRADWLKKLNLQAPKTADEMLAVMKAFVEQDPDANGKKDTYGINLSGIADTDIEHMFQSKPGDINFVVVNGQMVNGWEQKKAATEFKKKMFDQGLIQSDYLLDQGGNKAKEAWVTGKMGFFGTWRGNMQAEIETLKKNVPDAEVVAIPFPKTQYGQFSPALSAPAQMSTALSRGTKDPEAAIKLIDFMYKKTTQMTMGYGTEGTHYKVDNGCPAVIDAAKNKKEIVGRLIDNYVSKGILFGNKCGEETLMNKDNPAQKMVADIYTTGKKIYLDPNIPPAEFTHNEWRPQYPSDLNLIVNNTKKQITDIFSKSVVSGAAYTPDQALKDAMDVWEKAGGKKVDDWYKDWYQKNKDTWPMNKDIYTTAAKFQ